MPSVSVPLKDAPGWDALMRKRRSFWATGRQEPAHPALQSQRVLHP